MRRWLFNLAAGFSLLLFVATCVLWERSHASHIQVGIVATMQKANPVTEEKWARQHVEFERGTLSVYLTQSSDDGHVKKRRVQAQVSPVRMRGSFVIPQEFGTEYPGYRYEHRTWVLPVRRRFSQHHAEVSMWLLALVFAPLPATWLVTFKWRRSRRRIAKSLCGACGYDMRGSEGECPECGAECPKPIR